MRCQTQTPFISYSFLPTNSPQPGLGKIFPSSLTNLDHSPKLLFSHQFTLPPDEQVVYFTNSQPEKIWENAWELYAKCFSIIDETDEQIEWEKRSFCHEVFLGEGLVAIAKNPKQEATIMAMALIIEEKLGMGELCGVCVNPLVREIGYGNFLMDKVIERARALDLHYLYMHITKDSQLAERLYKAKGFRTPNIFEASMLPERELRPGEEKLILTVPGTSHLKWLVNQCREERIEAKWRSRNQSTDS